ncbi:hypothetical protein [Achromobacter spanius]|uniref:hypothetical protein n=1 Tax=Achromobacter spanius TaxID=217203 RepID=UPI00131A0832|nr:hypothetical protein [Achromobacter spanius]
MPVMRVPALRVLPARAMPARAMPARAMLMRAMLVRAKLVQAKLVQALRELARLAQAMQLLALRGPLRQTRVPLPPLHPPTEHSGPAPMRLRPWPAPTPMSFPRAVRCACA